MKSSLDSGKAFVQMGSCIQRTGNEAIQMGSRFQQTGDQAVGTADKQLVNEKPLASVHFRVRGHNFLHNRSFLA